MSSSVIRAVGLQGSETARETSSTARGNAAAPSRRPSLRREGAEALSVFAVRFRSAVADPFLRPATVTVVEDNLPMDSLECPLPRHSSSSSISYRKISGGGEEDSERGCGA